MTDSRNRRIAPRDRALGSVPSGLFILTAGTGEAATGALVSFVQQVGFEPPCLVVAIKKDRPLEHLLRDTARFCLSVIDDASMVLLGHFARGFAPGQPAFDGVAIAHDAEGVPYPTDTLAWMSCKIVGEAAWSDHIVFCAEVVDGDRRGDGGPMVHIRKTGASY